MRILVVENFLIKETKILNEERGCIKNKINVLRIAYKLSVQLSYF